MYKLTYHDAVDIFNIQKKYINKEIKKEHYNDALKDINIAGFWAYSFNFLYTDPDIENFIREISNNVLSPIDVCGKANTYAIIVKKCFDNRGLQQQYFRALAANGAEVLFIIIDDDHLCPDTIKEINAYEKATLLILGNGDLSEIDKAKEIVKVIDRFKPSKILIHSMPDEITTFIALNVINGVEKYNINLTDHAYWPGASFIDYNIEFRNYGYGISLEKRGFKHSQELTLPYYPISSKYSEFQGFENVPQSKVKIFTGGAYYKMFGENDAFFRLMDKILDLSENVVVLIAGSGDISNVKRRILSMNNFDRVYLIGNRRDIDSVFDNIDIYLGTYPFPGGLMTQFACQHGLPVLAYGSIKMPNSKVEGLCNHYSDAVHTYYDQKSLLQYADKLINNVNFRKSEGLQAKKAMLTPEKFNSEFWELMDTKRNKWNWTKEDIDYQFFTQWYIDLENNYNHFFSRSLIGMLKVKFLVRFPRYIPLLIDVCLSYALEKINRYFR